MNQFSAVHFPISDILYVISIIKLNYTTLRLTIFEKLYVTSKHGLKQHRIYKRNIGKIFMVPENNPIDALIWSLHQEVTKTI